MFNSILKIKKTYSNYTRLICSFLFHIIFFLQISIFQISDIIANSINSSNCLAPSSFFFNIWNNIREVTDSIKIISSYDVLKISKVEDTIDKIENNIPDNQYATYFRVILGIQRQLLNFKVKRNKDEYLFIARRINIALTSDLLFENLKFLDEFIALAKVALINYNSMKLNLTITEKNLMSDLQIRVTLLDNIFNKSLSFATINKLKASGNYFFNNWPVSLLPKGYEPSARECIKLLESQIIRADEFFYPKKIILDHLKKRARSFEIINLRKLNMIKLELSNIISNILPFQLAISYMPRAKQERFYSKRITVQNRYNSKTYSFNSFEFFLDLNSKFFEFNIKISNILLDFFLNFIRYAYSKSLTLINSTANALNDFMSRKYAKDIPVMRGNKSIRMTSNNRKIQRKTSSFNNFIVNIQNLNFKFSFKKAAIATLSAFLIWSYITIYPYVKNVEITDIESIIVQSNVQDVINSGKFPPQILDLLNNNERRIEASDVNALSENYLEVLHFLTLLKTNSTWNDFIEKSEEKYEIISLPNAYISNLPFRLFNKNYASKIESYKNKLFKTLKEASISNVFVLNESGNLETIDADNLMIYISLFDGKIPESESKVLINNIVSNFAKYEESNPQLIHIFAEQLKAYMSILDNYHDIILKENLKYIMNLIPSIKNYSKTNWNKNDIDVDREFNYQNKWNKSFEQAAEKYKISAFMLKAISIYETGGNHLAYNQGGYAGLMQLSMVEVEAYNKAHNTNYGFGRTKKVKKKWVYDLKGDIRFQPKIAIQIGAFTLSEKLKQLNNYLNLKDSHLQLERKDLDVDFLNINESYKFGIAAYNAGAWTIYQAILEYLNQAYPLDSKFKPGFTNVKKIHLTYDDVAKYIQKNKISPMRKAMNLLAEQNSYINPAKKLLEVNNYVESVYKIMGLSLTLDYPNLKDDAKPLFYLLHKSA